MHPPIKLLMLPFALAYHIVSTPRPSRNIQSLSRTISMSFQSTDTSYPYQPPRWAEGKLTKVPKHGRLRLANLPTPIHHIKTSNSSHSILRRLKELNINLYFKRDDATGGVELGGNKVRKLEFLLADALSEGCDAVVTIGGEQSNHCRATAAASRMVGLSPHIVLRTKRADDIYDEKESIGWTGNILFDRLVGSTIYTCTTGEYGRLGSNKLVKGICDHLIKSKTHTKPYPIPVGGSNGIGSWGYINGVDELMDQIQSVQEESPTFGLDHVVFATGSGGTAAGISLGLSLAYGKLGDGHSASEGKERPQIHGCGVCDSPDYFYKTMTELAKEMGIALLDTEIEKFVRDSITVHHSKGRGYAISTEEELEFISKFSLETGIALDPVYSGKALYHFLTKVLEENPHDFTNSNILFWHTGGALGIYEKGDELSNRLDANSGVKRIDIYGKKSDGANVVHLSQS